MFADTAVPGLVLGQIIGRFGNFMNREAFGEYTDSLFAMRLKVSDVTSANITSTMREHISIQDGIRYIQVHPTFLYEAAWNVLVLTAMLFYTKKKKFDGEIFSFISSDMVLAEHGLRDCVPTSYRLEQPELLYHRYFRRFL